MAIRRSTMEGLDLTLFGNVYAGRRVLVTGHTGFKGSWLTLWLQTLGARVAGLALDPDTDPSHWNLLALEGVHDHRTNLRDAEAVHEVLDTEAPEIIFHLAAQPLVRRSYHDPVTTFASNVTGLVNLLEAVRKCASVRVVVNVTTDKVYAEHDVSGGYRETDPLGGHDPYSSSKACAEIVTDCYRKSFFAATKPAVRLATARAGNVIGGGDWAEDRLIPDLVRAASSDQPLAIRNPNSTRPWQHVLEPLSGYLRLGQLLWNQPELAGAWNFGPVPAGTVTVADLVTRMQVHWPRLRVSHDARDKPREAPNLRLNIDKAGQALDWRPVWDLDTTLGKTARWYRAFHEHGQVGSRGDISAYMADAHHQHLSWAV